MLIFFFWKIFFFLENIGNLDKKYKKKQAKLIQQLKITSNWIRNDKNAFFTWCVTCYFQLTISRKLRIRCLMLEIFVFAKFSIFAINFFSKNHDWFRLWNPKNYWIVDFFKYKTWLKNNLHSFVQQIFNKFRSEFLKRDIKSYLTFDVIKSICTLLG